MKRILLLITALFFAALSGCNRELDIPYSNIANQGMNSFSAMFATGEHSTDEQAVFTTLIDPTKEEVLITVPSFFPVNTDNGTSIDKMRVFANIDVGCTIEPKIDGIYDLNEKHYFTFTNTNGVKTGHYFTGVKRLRLNSIIEFALTGAYEGVSAIIDEDNRKISLLSPDPVLGASAQVAVSPHATISPDPSAPRDYETPVEFTVTAHDGTSKATYTVQRGVPEKIVAGYRKGSEKLLWAHNLGTLLSLSPVANRNYSLAAIDNFIVLSTGDQQVYFNVTNGARIGNIAGSRDLGAGSITSDKANNMLLAAQADAGALFTIYTTDSPTAQPVELLTYMNGTGGSIGKKISVQGDVKRNAIITAAVYSWAGLETRFVRWEILNGTVLAPRIVTMTGIASGWNGNGNADMVYLTDRAEEGYMAISYSANTLYHMNNSTNSPNVSYKAPGAAWDSNMNMCTVDAVTFNNYRYVATFAGRHFTWGAGYRPFLFDVTSFSGFSEGRQMVYNPEQVPLSALGTWASSDVILWTSDDGFKMRMFCTDSNCQGLMAYEFDCIEK